MQYDDDNFIYFYIYVHGLKYTFLNKHLNVDIGYIKLNVQYVE